MKEEKLNRRSDKVQLLENKNKTISTESTSFKTKKPVRYSDEDLAEFKELILAKLHSSKMDFELIKDFISLDSDNGTSDTSPAFKLMEDGADVTSKEESVNHALRLKKYIEHLQNALNRIENKTYGICSMTGELISKERLRSVPHSTLSINAKLGILKK